MSIDRRSFLIRGAAASAALAGPFQALLARADGSHSNGQGHAHGNRADYGPLFPILDESTGLPLLLLPEGFRYVSFGWRGDAMEGGIPTPGSHDGMAALPGPHGRTYLVRNHEISSDLGVFAPGPSYDAGASGGTTTLEFDILRGALVKSWASITGTRTNCAGGPTPWGTWLTCEETLAEGGRLFKPHGYVFEVPATGRAMSPEPLRGLGRFVHEAVAIDPKTSVVYLTEDRGTSGFYRFIPDTPGQLANGGKLQMLGIAQAPKSDTRSGQLAQAPLDAVWYDILQPEKPHHNPGDNVGVFRQGFDQGGAVFARLEGAWYSAVDGIVYFISTNGGNMAQGQVWAFDPAAQTLCLIFESPSGSVLNAPDNITVSPRGGLVLCEDGSGVEYMHGLTVDGEIFRFAQNNIVLNGEKNGFIGDFTGAEFAGATYSPDGKWLFANIQSPGVTFAITGPWGRGAL